MNLLVSLGMTACLSLNMATPPSNNLRSLSDESRVTTNDVAQTMEEIALELQADPSCTDGVLEKPAYNEILAIIDARPALRNEDIEEDLLKLSIAGYIFDPGANNIIASTVYVAFEAEAKGAVDEANKWRDAGYIDQNHYDSAKHFLWSFRCMKNILISEDQTRAFTINYEWANCLLDNYKAHYKARLNVYLKAGYDEETAQGGARADALDFVNSLKLYNEPLCLQSIDKFNEIFNEDNIMDFHNNYIAREYSKDYFFWGEKEHKEAYSKALENGDLCVNVSNVDLALTLSVYNNVDRWYSGALN
ncbi:MAG: hypothetical protein J6D37_02685 [Clostridia bacterium]|nr:hypothetical protein [Clostridia bacterium]